jgi:L-alanine-DL-glutamate epimerase-like enolase superfamily enzyme
METIPVGVPVKSLNESYGLSPYIAGGRLRDVPDSLTFEEALERVESATDRGKKLLIKIDTENGITGWGEVKVPTMRTGKVLIEELIEPKLIGREVNDIESFVDEFRYFSSMYYTDITSYIGGVEIALWDALGKELQKPVHELIGGKTRDSIPIAYCLGLMSPEESRKHARFAYEHGFSVLKTKGSRYWRQDVERIKAMHDEVDGQLEFRLDPNQLWSVDEAVRVGAKLEDSGIYLQYMEQPIRIDSFGTLERLRERLRTPIAVNEDAYFPRNIAMASAKDAIDAAVVDLVPAKGILGFKRLMGVADDFGISLAHHSNFDLGIKNAAKLHAIASTPNFNLPIDSVYYAYEDYLLEEPLEIEDGRMNVPTKPGLAGKINQDKIEEYRLD